MKRRIPGMTFSAAISLAAIFCVPNIVNWSMGMGNEKILISIIGFAAACALSVISIYFMVYNSCTGKKRCSISPGTIVVRLFKTMAAILFCIMIFSLLCGVMATILYWVFKNILSFGIIKGMIDFIVSILVLMLMPFVVSVFWKEMHGEEDFIRTFIDGVFIKKKDYVRLLGVIVLLFGCGFLLTVIFRYVSNGFFASFIKAILFTVMGMMGIDFIEKIIR